MYLAKVFWKKELKHVLAYEKYEHALSDVLDIDGPLYDRLPDGYPDNIEGMRIVTASVDNLGYSVDFEYRFADEVTVAIEELISEESLR